jgi:tRNA (uracil-5-)-methyltransferase TRM9
MNADTVARLLELNKQFYQTFAVQFSATRQRLQPGVVRLAQRYLAGSSGKVLDLGCGNGELARRLAGYDFRGIYIGLDFSPGLIREARLAALQSFESAFLQVDLAEDSWLEGETGNRLQERAPFDYVLAFAVLHHLPGRELRMRVLSGARRLLSQQGMLIHSEWQFLNSPRLLARIQPWEAAGLTPGEVDQGDYLLDWRSGGSGLRYVHQFSLDELDQLAANAGFRILKTFESDGEGGRLGLYQVWEAL